MVMAVMALIIWKLWQVTMIMILIYDIPKLFLVPSKKQTGQLGCQCGVFLSVCQAIGSSSRHFDGYCFAE